MLKNMWVSILFVSFIVAGCASLKRTSTVPPGVNPLPPVEAPTVNDLPLPEGQWKVESQDFRPELTRWVEKNTKATYTKVAQEAQRQINKNGLIYIVDVKNLAEKYFGYKSLTLPNGHDIHFSTANSFEGTCGEKYVKVSVMGFENGLPILLTNDGPKTVKGLTLEKTLLRRSEADTTGVILYRPQAEPPWNIAPDGKSLIWQYDLKQSLLLQWWQKLARRYRELREERPYIAVRITEDKFVVETYEKTLLPAAYEQVNPNQKDDPYLIRRVYKPKGIVVDFEAKCT